MYKNIELLDKKKFKNTKFDVVNPFEIGKTMGVLPLGFNEVIDMAKYAPIIIMGDSDNLEFVAFGGISPQVTIFNDTTIYAPMFTRTYPFLNVILKDKKGDLKSVIGIDNGEFCGTKKEKKIFSSSGTVEPLALEKIEMVRELNRQRMISKKIIKELQKYDLLITKDFSISYGKETKMILEKFYIVDRKKLIEIDDLIIASWAKKGWITLVDMHLKSLSNFQEVVSSFID